MSGLEAALWIVGGLLAVHVFAGAARHLCTRRQPTGDDEKGLVIFAESIRWLGVRWGAGTVAAGLRDAGFEGRFLYWPWHTWWQGTLVLPAILAQGMLEREARKLADFITDRRREHPHRPIHLMGYSCGAFVAIRALELLDEDVQVDAAAMLAGAFDPGRDLRRARSRVSGPMVVTSSVADWLIIGLGTLIFGTADRRHSFSAGMVGLSRQDEAGIVEIRWRPRMIRSGHWGSHFGASARGFIARHVATAMGING